jgi:hypothetical protein
MGAVRWRARSSSVKFLAARALSLLPCEVSEREQRGEVDRRGCAGVSWYSCSIAELTHGVVSDVWTPSGVWCLTVVGR